MVAEYPFASHWFETGAGRLHYVDEGPRDAPTLLMLHGNPTWSFYYRRLIAQFRGRFRVVAPDHIGCGLSDKPQDHAYRLENRIQHIEALVASLGVKEVHLVVHDWGGAIGMGWAGRHPEMVGKIVVLNSAAFRSSQIPFSINLCRLPGFGALAVRGFNAFSEAALRRAVAHPERLSDAVKAGYLAPYKTWADRVAVLRFVQDIPLDANHPSYSTLQTVEHRLAKLANKPMLICWGAQDFCFDDSFLQEWKRRFPGARVDRIREAGHYVLEEAPERIVGQMERLLQEEVRA